MLLVSGWTLRSDAAVDEVEVMVDGRSTGPARLGIPRPDVFASHPLRWALSAGFEQQVDLSGLAAGTSVRVSAVGKWGDGNVHVIEEGVVRIGELPERASEPFDRSRR